MSSSSAPFLVKICGLRTPESLEAALDAGADMVGLVFFPASPRHVSVAEAVALADRARGRAEIVALTVDASDALISELLGSVRPDWLQLHGSEEPERAQALQRHGKARIMKAVGVGARGDLARLGAYSALDRLLLDAKPPKGATRPGGNGTAFDWDLLAPGDQLPPFLLSGGLGPENVAAAIGRLRDQPAMLGIDVSSGVESEPGVKDPGLIEAFIRAARAARSDHKDQLA